MIRLIKGSDRHHFPREIDEMHRIRSAVFHDRLGWEVEIKGGWEIDRFDEISPLYLVSIDPKTDQVRGSLRLLPTTGPNMLRDVFSELLPEGVVVESPTIWESTRFSIRSDIVAERSTNNQLAQTTGELLAGIVEVGMLAGLTQVVSVYDAMMRRVLRRAGADDEVLGEPKRIGEVLTYAGFFEISEAMLSSIRERNGIQGSVLEGECSRRALAA